MTYGRNYSYSTAKPRPRPPKRRRLMPILVLVLAVAVLGLGIFKARRVSAPNTSQSGQTEQKGPQPVNVEGKYLFSGTIVLARGVEKYAFGDYNQPFINMADFGTYDAGVIDLECPVTTNNVSYQSQIDNLVFNCRPEWLPTLLKYYQVVNLAGNHTRDMGAEGFTETIEHLQKAGIQAVGNYTPRVKEDICEVVALPVRVKKDDGAETKGQLPIAFCSWHYFSFDVEPGEIEVIQNYAQIMPVFALMHAGTEYLAKAQPNQVELAHKIIDAGPPEFLIGNSPHWVQNTEVYKDKLIVYSTGNFIFDQIDYETERGVSIAVSMTIDYDENVAKWLALGDACQARVDDCLEQAQAQNLQKIKLKLSYEPIGSVGGFRKVTKRADANLQKAIEERLNWAETIKQLKE